MADLSQYDDIFQAAGNEWNVDPTLLRAVAGVESGGNTRAVSPKGAQGLMQITPETQKYLGITDPNDPVQSIYGAAKYLSEGLDKEGTPEGALLYYHGGPGWRQAYGPESRAYVPAVTAQYVALKPQLSDQPQTAQPASAPQGPVILGDSLASPQGLGGTGQKGAQPNAIRAAIGAGNRSNAYQGRDVVLSSGASNAPGDMTNVEGQLQNLKDGNAGSVTLLGVGPGIESKNPGTNAALQALADKYGARFQPLPADQMGPDGVHPTGKGYRTLLAAVTPKTATDATPASAPAPTAPQGQGKAMASDDLPSWLPPAPSAGGGASAASATSSATSDGLPSWLPPAPKASTPQQETTPETAQDIGTSDEQTAPAWMSQTTPAIARVAGAASQAYRDTPALLTPEARAAVEQGGPVGNYLVSPLLQAGGVALGGLNALGAGAAAAIGEGATALGAPALGRDINMLAQVAPAAGMGAPGAATSPLQVFSPDAARAVAAGREAAQAGAPAARFGQTGGPTVSLDQLTRAVQEADQTNLPPGAIPTAAERAATREGAATPEAAAPSPSEHGQWVSNTANNIQQVVQENAAAGGPQNLGAAATPPGGAALTPAQTKAYRRMSELNQIVSPLEGEDNNIYVHGSTPTKAERMGDASTSQAEVLIRQRAPDAFDGPQGILTQNNKARVQAFDDLAGTDVQLADLKQLQKEAAERDGAEVVKNAGPVNPQPVADLVNGLLSDPRIAEQKNVVSVLKPLRDALYDADGSLKTDPMSYWGMHDNLQQVLAKGKDPMQATSAEKFAADRVNTVKQAVDKALDDASGGAFRTFLDNQAGYFQRINAMDQLQQFANKPRGGMLGPQGQINANNFHKFVTDLAIRRGRPGIDPAMDIPDSTMQGLINIDQDLKRAGRIDLGKPRGSPTNLFFELASGLGIAGAHALTAAVTHGAPVGNILLQGGINAAQRRIANFNLNRLVRQATQPPPGGYTPNPLSQPPLSGNPLTPP